MASCEIEIKSLLGSVERTQEVKDALQRLRPETKKFSHQKQLNHYFIGGNIAQLESVLSAYFSTEKQKNFKEIILKGRDFSIRTRRVDNDDPLFVVKVSLDEGSSHNTVSRMEFESAVEGISFSELDQLILDAGFKYQAKWSREREEYKSEDMTVCFDRNAGYGYIAEFEKIVDDESLAGSARAELHNVMNVLGVTELPQARLERMFAYYNKHWPEYYGTEKIFNIE
ncbi:hypothetical protein A3D62_01670 [Candidatus Kaiserbacteria bacterium RIFCSPHIGHO2_02_FULL_49_11]|uniref:CYTH domain-containing protein n=1 Tax=Candidatus Kaiserbacteria bacterium RIFCSPHIGHO2_02_FULL_49_11 TaxID=1798489 RepID=A0A1F6D1Y6_9BACT|nr:MAG: hypothetical protein A3D62_01670 [Candidatus Kaiserbacteria bacterium RIFCSPHIGHO2_02_FULL_49_11]